MSTNRWILVAEDDEADVFLLERAFREAELECTMRVARDGQECIEIIEDVMRRAEAGEPERLPCLMLLDLKMPRLTGMDVLRWRRSHALARSIPAIALSSSSNQHDIEVAYALGAHAYLVKPSSTEKRNQLIRLLKGFWLDFNQLPLACSEGIAAAKKLRAEEHFGRALL